MYVSYRRNNQVFWTRHQMLIPAGETLLSDGENFVRVRCGKFSECCSGYRELRYLKAWCVLLQYPCERSAKLA